MTSIPQVDVVGVGLNATDTLIPVPHFPMSGEKVEIRSANAMLGGQTASAMAACQQWGLRTRYVGKIGDDIHGEMHRAEFDRIGVEAHLFTAPGCPSQQAFILVDPSGERTVLWKRDSRLTLLRDELQRAWIINARMLLLDGHDTETATQAAQWAHGAGVPVVADLDDLYEGYEKLLPNIDYLITSRDIPSRLTTESDLRESLPKVALRYHCKLAAATLGNEGVLAWDGDRLVYAPAYRVEVADTTGAGDTFHAGFIYGFLQRWELQRQLEFACAAAALNCTAVGARGGIESVGKIQKLMTEGARHASAF
ncbi:MAG TPA: carbohydrate kinase family protein [Candidatus Acidoferrum sp.]|nr:carbohydrate kinase family protein [Candidatus Acidoferrum sp.]